MIVTNAATFVSGNIPTATWTISGSPYTVIGNCTVAAGQILTIQPGVTVIIGTGLNMDVNGQILALGSPTEPITFRGQDSTHYWNRIYVVWGGGADSRFEYCNFSQGITAVYLSMRSAGGTMATELSNCAFTNCGDCIYALNTLSGGAVPNLNPLITDCRFKSSTNGVHFDLYAGGPISPTIANNIFQGISGTAAWMYVSSGGYGSSYSPEIFNNVFKNCRYALVSQDPYDCTVENNVFSDSQTAVQKTGSLSLSVGYNCFFNNAANFVGYPAGVHGAICGGCVNHNGTPRDVLYNIFTNPLFCETTNFTLSASSPCIDAGDTASPFLDVCFAAGDCSPGSLGTSINDMGTYGGPYGCRLVPGAVPSIVTQPKSQSSCPGGSASFSVTAAGAIPIGYQWYLNGGVLNGKTSQNLTLTNLQANQAGPYTVVVTNFSGSVTSSPAQLVINDACVDIHMYAGLTISGQQGAKYYLKYTTDLAITNWASWTPLATNIMSSPNWFYVDMASPLVPKRFYGVKLTP